MLDSDTFLTTVYVMVDAFCKQHPAERIGRPGPVPSLTASDVITLGIFAQGNQFPTERAFYRLAHRRVCPAFPRLPHRRQFTSCGARNNSWPRRKHFCRTTHSL